jgi:hypothetical protein
MAFQQLAEARLLDAAALLAANRWAIAYYVAGYAVEYGLKASIARQTSAEDFPPEVKVVQDCHTHDLDKLVNAGGLKPALDAATAANSTLSGYWGTVKDWNEGSRYEQTAQPEAQEALYDAITDPANGVMQWIGLYLVRELIDDGQRLLERLPQEGFEVTAGFWMRLAEDGEWLFYVASPTVERDGLSAAYRRLHTIIRSMSQPFGIDPLEVKLIGETNPITKDVLAILSRAAGPKVCAINWGGKRLGSTCLEGAYLYPVLVKVGN